jgi:hypothetical protein
LYPALDVFRTLNWKQIRLELENVAFSLDAEQNPVAA